MTRGDDAVGEAVQVVEGDVRRVGMQVAQHIADDAHRAGAAEGLQPSHFAISLLHGLEFQPDGGACALEALRRRFGRRRRQLALKPTQPTDKLSSSSGLKPSPMTTSVDPPPMSITSRLSGLMGLVCATPE